MANSVIEELRRHHVYAPAMQQLGELPLDADKGQPRHMAGVKLHEHVDIAVWTKIVSKNGAEQR